MIDERRFTNLLAVTSVATYVLIVVGATVSLQDVTTACGTWPTCDGALFVAPGDAAFVAWGHRLAALVAGVLLVASVTASFVVDASRRLRLALGAALVLYPAQVAIGGLTVLSGQEFLPSVHLVAAMAIFTLTLVALTWRLETDAGEGEVETGAKTPAPEPDDGTPSANSTVRAYIDMTKPRLMWLLCLVAVAGMALAVAGGGSVTLGTAVATLAGGCLAIGASGTFNHVIERDRDRRMARTSDRPMANDAVPVRNAVAFGFALAVASGAVVVAFVNVLAAALTMLAIVFYSVVYTVILKPHTDQNVVIGGAVGALPALIGWAAVEGNVGVPALVLGGVIFLWTPAHFYNLALVYKDDYERADIPMLPVVRGDETTLRHINLYLGATLLSVSLLAYVSELGWAFAGVTVAAGAVFIYFVVRLHRERTRTAAMRAFHSSNAFLGAVMLVLAIETFVL
ncbi:MAG: protoheme IX farnesyltransferase [Methanobacteriota archaeon]|jgi:protoheme IX farnesyltransferase|uniref:Protoheme IX farnesyltransferase n=1 Tax=Halorutilus salinus TaxID=2487751 RepID=A0A9Q4GIJ5_9EURY|nr:heme o synthase [Halorutilus salinus]MCX2818873.1 heme o synthase [Halorutilus salinus]